MSVAKSRYSYLDRSSRRQILESLPSDEGPLKAYRRARAFLSVKVASWTRLLHFQIDGEPRQSERFCKVFQVLSRLC